MDIRRLLSDSLDIAYRKHPDAIAVTVGEQDYTYRNLYEQSQSIAAYLREQGFALGERVAIFMENGWPIVPSIFGVLYAGGVFLVINHLTKAHKLAYILQDSGAQFLLSDAAVAGQFLPVLSACPALQAVIYAGATIAADCHQPLVPLTQVLATAAVEPIYPKRINLDLAALIYTSGSTGDPKGVMMTHANMVFTSDSLIEYLRLDDQARIACFLPLAFDYGLYQILMAVRLGARLIVCKSFAFPAQVFNEINRTQTSVFPGVPTVFSTLIGIHHKTPLCFPSVTRVTNTAAALPPEYVPALKAIFPNALIYKMYGLTECKRVSYLPPEDVERFPASVGKAIPGTQVFILDEHRQPLPPNQMGTLYVRGAHVMRGYWNKPVETDKMLIKDLFPGENILCAQDQFTCDENGNLYFCGRVDDIIKSRGEKVSPVEVENVLYRLPGVREAAVLGIDDPIEGQTIKAFVAIDADSGLDEKKIRQFCTAHLENFMVPKVVEIRDSLPKTDSNKISKKDLRS
ncbi:MAG TPA: class I adenylate-forming enzyme family protein [Cellvibrionaceae bacterium]